MMSQVLIDTDILSYYLKGIPEVVRRLEEHELTSGAVFVSRITVVEVLAGLRAKNATKQEIRFRDFLSKRKVLELDERTGEISANMLAFLYQNGNHSGSYDVLIAATAVANNMTLCTNNLKDYQHLPGINLVNWKD